MPVWLLFPHWVKWNMVTYAPQRLNSKLVSSFICPTFSFVQTRKVRCTIIIACLLLASLWPRYQINQICIGHGIFITWTTTVIIAIQQEMDIHECVYMHTHVGVLLMPWGMQKGSNLPDFLNKVLNEKKS